VTQRRALHFAGRIVVQLSTDMVDRVKEEILPTRFHKQHARPRRWGIDTLDEALRSAGVHSIRRLFRRGSAEAALHGFYVVRFHPGYGVRRLQAALQSRRGVTSASPDFCRSLLASGAGAPVPMQSVLNAVAWPSDVALDSALPRPLVAVIDTGVQIGPLHPVLAQNTEVLRDTVDLLMDLPPSGFDWDSADLSAPDDEPQDEIGHGTHVAAMILGSPQSTFCGVAPRARLLAIRALAPTRRISDGVVSAFGSASNVAAAIDFASSRGAAVINMSFGFPRLSPIERAAITRASQRGCVLVAAIGNSGEDASNLFPSRYPQVIAVGAVDLAGNRLPISQTGSHLHVVAPGDSITSAALNSGFSARSGTSMAAAVVSGVAALMKSVRPQITPVELSELLRQTAHPGTVHNDRVGWGRIDAAAAVQAARG